MAQTSRGRGIGGTSGVDVRSPSGLACSQSSVGVLLAPIEPVHARIVSVSILVTTAPSRPSVPLEAERGVARDVVDVLREVRDSDLRLRTLNLFQELGQQKFDICVMAARRMSCLYLALLEAGMPPLPYPVVTDRDLEVLAHSTDLARKRIALVDDTVVVGSTLFYLQRTLEKLAGSEATIEVFTVCADEKERHPAVLASLSLHKSAGLEVSAERARDFSADLSRTLFVNLIPYLGDFPTSRLVHISAATTLGLLRSLDWTACDVTPLDSDGFTASYTFLANRRMARRVHTSLEVLAAGFGEILAVSKVRMYTSQHSGRPLCRLAPLGLIRETHERDLDTIAADVAVAVGGQREYAALGLDTELSTEVKAKLQYRFLQAVASVAVARQFFVTAGEHGLMLTAESFEPQFIELNFGPGLAPLIARAVSHLFSQETGVAPASRSDSQRHLVAPQARSLSADFQPYAEAVRVLIKSTGTPFATSPPKPGLVLRVGQCPVGFVAQLFGFINGRFEARERRLLRRIKTAAQFLEEYPDPRSRSLQRGLSLQQIAAVITDDPNAWTLCYASLSLDVCNDSGIVVPVNVYDPQVGSVRRMYRIGENAWESMFPFAPSGRPRGRSFDLADRTTWLVTRLREIAVDAGEHESLLGPADAEIAAMKTYRETVDRILTHESPKRS